MKPIFQRHQIFVFLIFIVFSTQTSAQNKTKVDSKTPLISVKNHNSSPQIGYISFINQDSLVLQLARNSYSNQIKTHINDISEITLVKKSSLRKMLGISLMLGGVGAMIGFGSGDDPPGWFSWSAGEKATLLGILLGGTPAIIGGTYHALKGVDIEIPLNGKLFKERVRIIKQIRFNKYIYKPKLQISAASNIIKFADLGSVQGFIGKIRINFNPRSGIEILHGESSWGSIESYSFDETTRNEKLKKSYQAFNFFIKASNNKKINPLISWGICRFSGRSHRKISRENYLGEIEKNEYEIDESSIGFNLFVGFDVPISNRLSFEMKSGTLLDFGNGIHKCLQAGIIINPF